MGSPKEDFQEQGISIHIFAASAGMVGVCLTVIELFHVSRKLADFSKIGDQILAVDAIAFLISCILAYCAIRTKGSKRRYAVEKIADVVFLAALCLMASVCGLIAYEFV